MQKIQKFRADVEYVNLKIGLFWEESFFSRLMNPKMCFKVVILTWNFVFNNKIGFYDQKKFKWHNWNSTSIHSYAGLDDECKQTLFDRYQR